MIVTQSISVGPEDKRLLDKLDKSPSTPQGIALRARIVGLLSQGVTNSEIARRLSVSRPTIDLWKSRYRKLGVDGLLHIEAGRGRKRQVKEKVVESIIYDTLHTSPPDATHWSTRSLAQKHGVSHDFVKQVWDTHGLKPWLIKTFKVSNDPQFIDKLKDVVGLYLNPPEHALIFSVDEKTQIQALERTQKPLPLSSGHLKTGTHDYTRHGTTTLFAALNVLKGEVIGACIKKHRHQEFITFLKKIEMAVDKNLEIHCIVDNYSTHKHPAVQDWLKVHSRFHLHFIPTSSSWLNLVERWFSEITTKRIRRGSFKSERELIKAIEEYITYHNEQPKPFVWTKSANEILAKVNSCKSILPTAH